MDKPDYDVLAKAMEASAEHQATVTQILTLAVEYEAKTITAERFAERCLDILRRTYTKYIAVASTSTRHR